MSRLLAFFGTAATLFGAAAAELIVAGGQRFELLDHDIDGVPIDYTSHFDRVLSPTECVELYALRNTAMQGYYHGTGGVWEVQRSGDAPFGCAMKHGELSIFDWTYGRVVNKPPIQAVSGLGAWKLIVKAPPLPLTDEELLKLVEDKQC